MALFANKKLKVPTIIGVVVLVVGAVAGVLLVRSGTGFLPRAAPEFAPKDLTVTNITENSFTISWVTQQKTLGFLKYGTSPTRLDEVAEDDRDQIANNRGTFATHHITVRGLSPQSTYYFKVASGGENQLYDNSGQPYSVTTASVGGVPPVADTAYGEVVTGASVPASDAIVYVSLPGAARLSTLVRDGGQWALSLSTARTPTLTDYVDYDETSTLYDVLIKGDAFTQSKVIASAGADSPLPTITLGDDFDFSAQVASTEPGSASEAAVLDQATTDAVESVTKSGFNLEPLGNVVEATEELTILNPASEAEGINTTQPEFYGTAPAGTVLTIEVHSETKYSDQVVVADSNTWAWSPPSDLEPGEHTVTVSYTDEQGILQSLTRSFVVYAAETSDVPAFVATPSATPKPTPKPTPTTVAATPRPTAPPRVSQPSTSSGVPKSGSVEGTVGLLTIGLFMVLIGGSLNKFKWLN